MLIDPFRRSDLLIPEGAKIRGEDLPAMNWKGLRINLERERSLASSRRSELVEGRKKRIKDPVVLLISKIHLLYLNRLLNLNLSMDLLDRKRWIRMEN